MALYKHPQALTPSKDGAQCYAGMTVRRHVLRGNLPLGVPNQRHFCGIMEGPASLDDDRRGA